MRGEFFTRTQNPRGGGLWEAACPEGWGGNEETRGCPVDGKAPKGGGESTGKRGKTGGGGKIVSNVPKLEELQGRELPPGEPVGGPRGGMLLDKWGGEILGKAFFSPGNGKEG